VALTGEGGYLGGWCRALSGWRAVKNVAALLSMAALDEGEKLSIIERKRLLSFLFSLSLSSIFKTAAIIGGSGVAAIA